MHGSCCTAGCMVTGAMAEPLWRSQIAVLHCGHRLLVSWMCTSHAAPQRSQALLELCVDELAAHGGKMIMEQCIIFHRGA